MTIRDLRRQAGFDTQAEAAQALGFTHEHVSRIEAVPPKVTVPQWLPLLYRALARLTPEEREDLLLTQLVGER